MARPSGDKTRNGGQWTEARFKSFITSLLRSGTKRWGPKNEAKKEARQSRGIYECASCGEHGPASIREGGKKYDNAAVDHIRPVVDPSVGFTTWDEYIENMFCEKENFQILCHKCHSEKSLDERLTAVDRRRKEKEELNE